MFTTNWDQRTGGSNLLVTGATGFLGAAFLAETLASTDARVTCLVRAHDESEALDRVLTALHPWLGVDGARESFGRLRALPADITAPCLGLEQTAWLELAEWTTEIVHCAATVRFDEPLSVARAVNVGGVRNVLELAWASLHAGSLVRAVMVSTAYVAGTSTRSFAEDDLDVGQAFRNAYERSKFEAEEVVRCAAERLPVCVVRPSIIVGHSENGLTTAFNVLYAPLRMLLRRAGSTTLPVRADTVIDTVPVDWVARLILATLRSGHDGATYAGASGAGALTAGDVADLASDVFGMERLSLLPASASERVMGELAGAWQDTLTSRERDALAVYAPYMSRNARFDTTHGDALMLRAGHRPAEPRDVLARCLEYARATNFGRSRRVVVGRRRSAVEVASSAVA